MIGSDLYNDNYSARHTPMTQGLKNKSCAVVGSSPILLKKEYGKDIDSHDIVVRCQDQRLEGFENSP